MQEVVIMDSGPMINNHLNNWYLNGRYLNYGDILHFRDWGLSLIFENNKIYLIDKELDFDNVKQPHKDHEAERELKFSCIMGRDLCVEKVVVTRS